MRQDEKSSSRRGSVNWLGPLPSSWEIAPLKTLVDPERKITYGIVQAGVDTPGGVPYIRPADMSDEAGVLDPDRVLRAASEIAEGYRRSTVRSGDLVCSIGPSFGKVMVVPDWLDGGNLTQGTARVAVAKGVCAKYVFWALRSVRSVAQWEASIGGATFRALNLEPLANTWLPKPPLEEQIRISAFLDRETAKIDTLIAEQERLLELLAVKRQAVISRAVTKGLNPDAPMTDSRVAWLGEVPAHWDVVRLATLYREVNEPGSDDRPTLSVSIHDGVSDDEIDEAYSERKITRSEDKGKYKRVEPNDLTYNMMRAWQGAFGAVTVSGQVSPAYVVARPRTIIETGFIEALLRTPKAKEQIRRYSRGITDFRLRLYWDEFKELRVGVPPHNEQVEVLGSIGRMNRQFDELQSAAEQLIALLHERRSALIAAAVTGQIDVREAA